MQAFVRIAGTGSALVAVAGATATALVTLPAAPHQGTGAAPRTVVYSPPATGPLRVVRAFDAPADPYGPGHRGVDLGAAGRGPVRAAGAGTVTFAGQVAGRGVVVVAHADGVRTEYEPVRPQVSAGRAVARGQVIGAVSGRHRDCPVPVCLHWGARRGERYLDPLSLLRRLGPVRLLPWAGGAVRRAGGPAGTFAAAARPTRACRSAWLRDRRGRAPPAPSAGRHRPRAGV